MQQEKSCCNSVCNKGNITRSAQLNCGVNLSSVPRVVEKAPDLAKWAIQLAGCGVNALSGIHNQYSFAGLISAAHQTLLRWAINRQRILQYFHCRIELRIRDGQRYRKRITLPYAPQVSRSSPCPARVAGFSVQSPLTARPFADVKLCRNHRPQTAYRRDGRNVSLASINVFVRRWPS